MGKSFIPAKYDEDGSGVLLILKSSPAREALSKALVEDGFDVDVTDSSFRGVSGLARRGRDVIVLGLDDLMDEELEAIKVIRADCPDSFVLVTFSHVNRRRARQAMQLGADAYVLEPLNVDEVRTVLARYRPERAEPQQVGTEPTETVTPACPANTEDEESRSRRVGRTPGKSVRMQEILDKLDGLPSKQSEPSPTITVEPNGPAYRTGKPLPSLPTGKPPAGGKSADVGISLRKLGASVAHEINNPLTTLSGWIQLLLRKVNGNQDLHRTLLSMKEEADRIADVVRELSAMTEPNMSGQGSTDFNELTSMIIDNFLATNGNASIHIKTVLTNEPACVDVDVELVVRAISDLLNSRYLSLGSSGSLVFRTIRNGPDAELHVYEPGSQVNLSGLQHALESLDLNEGDTIGEDLSLARAKQILDSHQGSFQVECELREGLSFVVKFPLAD